MDYNKIRVFLDKHKKMDYVQKCIRHIKNNDFVDDVLDLHRNPMLIKFETLGELNKDKNIFLIENKSSTSGFFATYRFMLNALYFAERFNLIPVINYTSNFVYAENCEINGTVNPFEYYFEQVSDISLEEAYASYNIVRYRWHYNKLAEQLNEEGVYTVSDSYILSMANISKKYIRLNTYIKPILDKNITDILKGKRTIGVHVRGTDFYVGYNNHPIVVTPMEYIKYVEEALLEYKFDQIFLATDEESTIGLFEEAFGNNLVYYKDVMRTNSKTSVASSNSDRMNHHYLLGLEVLRDMLTLANCDGLIAGMSQVSICSRITKASEEKKYEYLKIIDKGININSLFT